MHYRNNDIQLTRRVSAARSVATLARHIFRIVSLALLFLGVSVLTTGTARAAGPHVDVVTIDTAINPAAASILDRAVETAEKDEATTLVIQLDTPGGDLGSMTRMVQRILHARLPIIVYVSPAGGRAASAGTFITLAAPVAAMAPSTQIGAAHPVGGDGRDIPGVLGEKVTNYSASQIVGLATLYNRSAVWAESAVRQSASLNDTQAVQKQSDGKPVVDLQASSLSDLLTKVDGRTVKLTNGTQVTLQTANLPVTFIRRGPFDRLESLILNPNVAVIAFVLGAFGVTVEIFNPGLILPGVVGAIGSIVFLFDIGTIPVNFAGLALLAAALVMFVLDVKLTSHGALTIGGMVAMFLGATLLFNTGPTAVTTSPVVTSTMVGVLGVGSFLLMRMALKAHQLPVTTGQEGMIGAIATVTTTLEPTGYVRVHGELWHAEVDSVTSPVFVGEQVRIAGISGLKLHVTRV